MRSRLDLDAVPLLAVIIWYEDLAAIRLGLGAVVAVADLVGEDVLHGEGVHLDPLAVPIHEDLNGAVTTRQVNGELERTRLVWSLEQRQFIKKTDELNGIFKKWN